MSPKWVFLLMLLALCYASSQAQDKAELEKVELKLRVDDSLTLAMPFTKKYLEESTVGKVSAVTEPFDSVESAEEALLSGKIDMLLSPHPVTKVASNGDVLHFPISTSGLVFITNIKPLTTLSFNAKQIADIFSGRVKRWKDASLTKVDRWLSEVNEEIKVVAWDVEGSEARQVRRYLELETPSSWPLSSSFTSEAIVKSTLKEALEYVQSTPGTITYVPFGSQDANMFPIQLFVVQTDDFVSPTAAAFKNALMPFKTPADVPKPDQTSTWKAWTLSDMSKMPPDGSCMSMPPYPLARFLYAIVKRDHSQTKAKGAAIAGLLRLIFSPNVQSFFTNSKLHAAAPSSALLQNIDSLKMLRIHPSDTLDMYIATAPIAATEEDNMDNNPNMPPGMTPGSGSMGNMQPASTSAVVVLIVTLLLSGIVSVVIYLVLQHFYFKNQLVDISEFLPSFLQSAKCMPRSYQPLSNENQSPI